MLANTYPVTQEGNSKTKLQLKNWRKLSAENWENMPIGQL